MTTKCDTAGRRQGSMLLLSLWIIFALVLPASAAEKTPYYSLLPDTHAGPSGHIIIRIAQERKVPSGWKMDWFVAIDSPGGYRLSLGRLEDKDPLGERSRMVVKIPAGTYRLQVTRRPPEWHVSALGAFDFDKGEWVLFPSDALVVGSIEVAVGANQVKVVEIRYEDAQVLHEDRSGELRRTIYLWRNWRMSVREGTNTEIPTEPPEVHPVTQNRSFAEVTEADFVAALKGIGSAAADALVRRGKTDVGLLLSALEEESLEFNASVARVLARSGDARAGAFLVRELEQGGEETRYLAAWALGELRDSRAVDALIQALKADSIMVRSYAVYALARIQDRRALAALAEAAKDSACMEGTLVLLADFEVATLFLLDERFQTVGEVIPIRSFCVGRNAIYALGQLRDPQAIEPLLQLLESPEQIVQIDAIEALSLYRDQRVVTALLAQLKSEPPVRWLAVHALGAIGDPRALGPLEELSKTDPDASVREAATMAVEKIKRPK